MQFRRQVDFSLSTCSGNNRNLLTLRIDLLVERIWESILISYTKHFVGGEKV